MKALVKEAPGEGLTLKDVPEPAIGPDDVLIKVRKTGICGTDIHIWNWDDWAQRTIPVPMIVGHEYAGEIVDLGSSVRGLHLGQRRTGRCESRRPAQLRPRFQPPQLLVGVFEVAAAVVVLDRLLDLAGLDRLAVVLGGEIGDVAQHLLDTGDLPRHQV